MYLEDFTKAKGKLRYWNELLQEWVFMVHRVYRISKKRSAVYAEKERANTGLLAAAAIKNGWIALEESSTQKYNKKTGKETYKGRSDLILWRDQRHHEIEAKFMRHVLFSKNRARINRVYNRALSDSSRSTFSGLKSEKKIAITYIVPIINISRLEKSSNEDIANELNLLIKDIKKEHKPLLMSYAFPGPVNMEGAKRKALGVIMIGELTSA